MPLQSDKLRLLRRIPDIRFEEEPRGYSKDQVDRVLANLAPLAGEIERLQARLAEAETRAASAEARLVEARSPSQAANAPGMPPPPEPDFDETLRNTLVSAQRQADLTVREAKEEAERLRTEAEFQSNALLADARDQSAEMTTEAVAHRERLMAEAASERARMLDDARDDARGRVKAVEEELIGAHEAERGRLIGEISELQSTHDLLRDDIGRMEKHIEGRSIEVRSAIEDVLAVIDDPGRLRSTNGIEPADIGEFDPESYPPIAVEVVALNDLETEAEAATEALPEPSPAVGVEELEELAPDGEVDDDDTFDDDAFDDEWDGEDPELGVKTQTIAPPPLDDPGPFLDDETLPPSAGGGDPFLDELRRVTNEEPEQDDPITDFLDDDKRDRGSGGWFGRRR